jgi:NADH-quinone oxidoreductase subunit M
VVKIPLVPFHTWLPSAYAEAPPAITMLMSALMAKLGTLGLLRIVIPLCPDAAVQYGLPVFGTLGAIGVVYASCCAFAQRDLKLLAAYSSVAHLGLLVLGVFALNTEGLTGAALHMVNHGLTAGLMFAVVCFLADRYRTTDMTLFGGLMKQYPKFAFFTM